MTENEKVQQLVDFLNQRTKEYDEGHPTISDKEWDSAYFELVRLENKTGIYLPNSPTQNISYEVVNQLEKVIHNHKMLSLAKTKELTEVGSFLVGHDYVAMCKMDGLTCSLKYIDGVLVSAETRGNGIIGEDVFHNAKVITNIPKRIPISGEFVVDGEIICSYHDFEEFASSYKNPRNFASGSIRLLDSSECANRKLQFVAWDVIQGFEDLPYFFNKLDNLKLAGFTVVPYSYTQNLETDVEKLQTAAKELGYPIDGIVFKFDDIKYGQALGETAHHFKNAIAYKFYDETYATTMKDIEWTMGRTGVLTPVAVFEPVEADGSIIERASLHNVSVMYETLHGGSWVGQEIEVFKANMIIPQIASANPYPPQGAKMIPMIEKCPICGQPIQIEESDSKIKTMVCKNPECDGKLINKLDHFCGKKGLDIKGLSKATLEKLIEWEWVTAPADIFTLKTHRLEWMKKPGFGQKSVDNILASIEKSKSPSLEAFISSLGIPLIGSTVSKDLVKYISSYEELREKVKSKFNFSVYDGFSAMKTASLWHFNYKDGDEVYAFLSIAKPVENEVASDSLSGATVVITGKLNLYKNRAALQSAIEAAGGKVASSVSSKTTYLINNDSTSSSAKNLSAKKLGIEILTELEFQKKFLDI